MSTLQELLQKADSYKQKISSAPPLAKEELKSLEDGITVRDRPLKDYYETVGHGAAYDFMLELARQQDMVITEEAIKKLHCLFYQKVDAGQAGRYRSIQVSISETEYVPPAPDEVPRLMKHLADQIYSSRTTLHPIELAAMAHKRLIDIHPFIDGNARAASLLMNVILVHAGYGAVLIPPDWKNDYINALSASRRLNDMEPFSKLIAECVIETERDYCRLLKL